MSAPRPESGGGAGWGLGFARFKNLSSYLGVVMQLRADASSGQIALLKAIAVCDAGLVINPDGLKAQIEGGIVQSASWTLKEHVKISSSQIQTRDWSTYPILRFDEVPDVIVHLVDRRDQKSLGVGETAQGPTAAAIANAVFHATGHRLRRLPFTPDRFT
jgi:CO/xanthine dehydrogenase Mo-binding subunit